MTRNINSVKVLFVQVDYLTSKEVKHWAYWNHFGLAEGLREAGADVTVTLAHQWDMISALLSTNEYNVIVLNDIIHGLSYPRVGLDLAKLGLLRDHCQVMVGIMSESLYGYTSIDGSTPDFVQYRISKVEQVLDYFDTLWPVDENDCDRIRSAPTNPLVLRPFFSSRVGSIPTRELDSKKGYLFIGTINEHRARFISQLGDTNLLIGKISSEDELYWDRYCALAQEKTTTFAEHQNKMRLLGEIRIQASRNYLGAISNYRGLVHIPTYQKTLHPRFIEAIAAGVVPVMPYSPDLESCGLEANVHYLPYSEKDPTTLNIALKYADRNLGFLREIYINAHTIVCERYLDRQFCGNAVATMKSLIQRDDKQHGMAQQSPRSGIEPLGSNYFLPTVGNLPAG